MHCTLTLGPALSPFQSAFDYMSNLTVTPPFLSPPAPPWPQTGVHFTINHVFKSLGHQPLLNFSKIQLRSHKNRPGFQHNASHNFQGWDLEQEASRHLWKPRPDQLVIKQLQGDILKEKTTSIFLTIAISVGWVRSYREGGTKNVGGKGILPQCVSCTWHFQ